jgi:ABC-type Fe3+-hydroxamate transport system substrate-binding protein
MAPAAVEMLEALEALDQVVGIGDFVLEPASITHLPRLGAYNAPNVELVLSLGTDTFITAASEAANAAHERLESLGVQVLALDTSTYDGVFTSLHEVGRALGRSDLARAVEQDIRDRLRAMEQRAAHAPARSVLFVVGRDPVYVAGPGSHIDEMIALVGGVNVAHDALSPYQRVSMEAILERMPEVIIDTSDNRPSALRGRLAGDWERWDFLPAVREGRVYWVDPSRLVIPGIRLPEMTSLMGRLIQPEIFGEAAEAELAAPADGEGS